MQQTRYEMRLGESVQIAAPPETLDFLLKAKSLRVEVGGAETNWVAAPNRARDRVLVAAPILTSPGEYTAKLSATSAAGEERAATLAITLKPRQTVPANATRPPVVLLNGWETGFTGTCPLTSASDTFGNLAQYLVYDGVPVVYFFDNCAVDANQTIEVLGNDLGTFLKTITYDNGDQVPQIDLVAFSMGGLIARAYLAGLQTDGTATPPATTLVRDLILIATPNFGSFVAGNYATILTAEAGTQSAELVPASSFLWNLATWNQRGDDLRGVNALAIVGNAGPYLASLEATTQLNNASDGLVSLTSAALGFALPNATSPDATTQIVPYCHVDPSVFTNTALLGTFNCNAAGIANVTSDTQETGRIVRSFLAGTSDWQSVGGTGPADQWLSIDGGIFFAVENQSNAYVMDLTASQWGTVALTDGGDNGVVFYTDFVNGTGVYQATSSSLGSIFCGGSLTEALGYFSAARCKIDPAIFSVAPLSSAPGRIVSSGGTITLTGYDFGAQCTSCQVLATPAGSTTQTALQVSSWTNTAISATLPASFTGLLTVAVVATTGTDAITIMASPLAVTPWNLQFAYTTGGSVPEARSIQITNSGSGTVTWTATASDSWLSVSPASGTFPSTLSVSVSPASLAAGTYTGTVLITPSGATNSPLTVYVSLTVAAPSTAALAVTPQALSFTYAPSGTVPAAQTVSIANAGSGTLSWIAWSSVSWVSLSAASGTATATLSVSVNPAGLAAGNYTGNVQIAAAGAAGSPASVTVTLAVGGTQPDVVITGVVNGGSFAAGFASATWISIFGTSLSTSTATWIAGDFVNSLLPTALDGVSVTIDGIPAYVEFISPGQINVLAPDDATTGAVQVQVTAAGQKSNSFTAQKQPFAPAFFTIGNGKYVAAQHADYSLLGAPALIAGVTSTPAQPGETILMYGTGFGPTNPAVPTADLVSTAEPLANNFTITIGGVTASWIFAGLVEPGLYQFNVTVPNGLPSGDAAVVATIGGVQTQSGVSITIQVGQ